MKCGKMMPTAPTIDALSNIGVNVITSDRVDIVFLEMTVSPLTRKLIWPKSAQSDKLLIVIAVLMIDDDIPSGRHISSYIPDPYRTSSQCIAGLRAFPGFNITLDPRKPHNRSVKHKR